MNATLPSRDIHVEIEGVKVFMNRAQLDNIVRHVAEEGMTEEAVDAIMRLNVVEWETGDLYSDLITLEEWICDRAELS